MGCGVFEVPAVGGCVAVPEATPVLAALTWAVRDVDVVPWAEAN